MRVTGRGEPAASEQQTSAVAFQVRLKNLHRLLSVAQPEDMMRVLWALDALQDGRLDAARKVVPNFPAEAAVNTDPSFAIHRWELETLAMQYFITPPEGARRGRIRWIDLTDFAQAIKLINALRNAENTEAGLYCTPENVIAELSRVSQRQFHWQRGYLNKTNFYRSAFLYGQGECASYFETRCGLAPNELSIVGFSFNASTVSNWGLAGDWDLSRLGLTPATFRAGVALVSAPIDRLRSLAGERRVAHRPIAYQISPLREFPLVQFRQGLIAPIRDLILMRTTSGIYYDLVAAGGSVLSEIGVRFERYAMEFLRCVLSTLKVEGEHLYGPRSRRLASPDLRLRSGDRCKVLVECKATKMTLDAKFSDRPTEEATRGFAELSKGVFQIWRYCSHIRRGLAGDALADDPVGLVLTLDDWTMISAPAYAAILDGAERLADQDHGIVPIDRIPITISSIDDVELTALQASDQGFVQALLHASQPDFFGWLLPSVLQQHGLVADTRRPHPFADRLADVLPWWGILEAEALRGRRSNQIS